jgi:hypothetical protein
MLWEQDESSLMNSVWFRQTAFHSLFKIKKWEVKNVYIYHD